MESHAHAYLYYDCFVLFMQWSNKADKWQMNFNQNVSHLIRKYRWYFVVVVFIFRFEWCQTHLFTSIEMDSRSLPPDGPAHSKVSAIVHYADYYFRWKIIFKSNRMYSKSSIRNGIVAFDLVPMVIAKNMLSAEIKSRQVKFMCDNIFT